VPEFDDDDDVCSEGFADIIRKLLHLDKCEYHEI
jgi:hypothetical protein